MTEYFSGFSSLCGDLPRHDDYGRSLAPDRPRALAVLDVYQTRALEKQFEVVSVGLLDGAYALESLEPSLVIYQTTGRAVHSAWRGRLTAAGSPNAHLLDLLTAASRNSVTTVGLCTVAPEALGEYVASLEVADLVLSARTDSAAALRKACRAGTEIMAPQDVVESVLSSHRAASERDRLVMCLGQTYFSSALRAAQPAKSRAAEGLS